MTTIARSPNMKGVFNKARLVVLITTAALVALAWRCDDGQQYIGIKQLAEQQCTHGTRSAGEAIDSVNKSTSINKTDNRLTDQKVDPGRRFTEEHYKSDTDTSTNIDKGSHGSALNGQPGFDERLNTSFVTNIDNETAPNNQQRFAKRTGHYVYPVGGTGVTVDISDDFNATVINAFCETNGNLKAVIPIYSAPGFFEIRNTLRNTLGKWAMTLNCKILFIVGVSLNNHTNALLRAEYYMAKDILMMAKMDSYRDLNDKAVTMVEWISKHCTNVPYVIHMIDDAYVNIEKFLSHLHSIREDYYILGGDQGIYRTPRFRRETKNFLTKEEYPEKFLPRHLIGFAYAFPTPVAKRLLSVVHTAQYCYVEDIWLTGHVREEAKVELKGLMRPKDWIAEGNLAKTPALYKNLTSYYFAHSIKAERFASLYPSV